LGIVALWCDTSPENNTIGVGWQYTVNKLSSSTYTVVTYGRQMQYRE
jgi:hypothetical protein